MRHVWLIFVVVLAGCSVRPEPPQSSSAIDPEKKMFALDETNVSLAEKSSSLDDFPKLLAAAGKSHSYHEWNQTFIEETMVAVKELAPGEALQEQFYAESERGLEEVRIRLIKKDTTHAIVRMTCSNPSVVAEIQADLDGALAP